MHYQACRIALFLAVISLGFAVFCQNADARKRGLPLFIIFNTGSEIYPVAPLPLDLLETNHDFVGWQLGYKCSHFGILWADVRCWDKELVIFKGDTYADIPDEMRLALERQYPWSKTKRNIWNKYGSLFLIGFIAIIFIARRKDDE